MANKQFESRVVVLKRCDLPKNKSILSLNSLEGCDSYISFQNYHFIDILPSNQTGDLPSAYEQIRMNRHKSQEEAVTDKDTLTYRPELHTVQSMTLLGEKTSFWNTASDVLYITFIQLRDSSQWIYDKIVHEMSNLYPDTNENGQEYSRWALCYSLDFCDLILFSRGIALSELNDLLWRMTISNDPGFTDIQDTFTICAFSHFFLKHAFSEIEKGNSVDWNDMLALSCKVGIQHPKSLILIKEAINRIGINWKSFKLTGRYDLLIEAQEISGEQVLHFFYEIDKLTSGTSNHILANYEVTLMSPMRDDMYVDLYAPDFDNSFYEAMSRRIAEKYNNYQITKEAEIGFVDDYVFETMHSLQELLRNGFAEEFVLSVLPSFEAYLTVAKDLSDYIRKNSDTKYEINVKKHIAQFDDLTREFFSAVNTLASCTMHNERQFVQAPSFNAAYFEIPPKLLVFYNALVKEITKRLHTKSDDYYQFLIAPDYRHNINVLPFDSVGGIAQNQHIAIIYLSEKYFYDPAKAILLLGHEVGHYIGNRFREERAKEIFTAIGCVLFYVYFPTPKALNPSEASQICRISGEAIGKFIYNEYCKTRTNPALTFYFDDVRMYVSNFVNLLPSPEINEYGSEMAKQLGNSLYWYAKKNPDFIPTYQHILYSLDTDNVTSYYGSESIFADDYRFGCNTLARLIINELISVFNPILDTSGSNHANFLRACESIVQAFSESFADLQMLRISGNLFDVAQYVELLLEEEESVDRSIRFHVMRYLTSILNVQSKQDFEAYDSRFMYPNAYCIIIEELVKRYLSHCDSKICQLQDIDPFFTQSPDLYAQAINICKFSHQYKCQI